MKQKRLTIVRMAALMVLLAGAPQTVAAVDIFLNGELQRYVERGRLDREVREAISAKGKSEVLVLLAEDVAGSLSTGQNNLQDRLNSRVRSLTGKKKGLLDRLSPASFTELSSYPHFPVMHLQVDEQALSSLLNRDEVLAVGYNRGLRPFLSESLPLVHALQVHSRGITGNGTSVAVLDTGVDYRLSAFGNCSSPGVPSTCKVVYAQDIAESDNSLDDSGHGTNVAGIVLGVAPDTRIIALDVFRADGYTYYSDLLTALNWVVSNKAAYNIVAVNMSLGGGSFSAPCPTDFLANAVATLRSIGVLTAVASGNDAYNGSMATPGCIPGVLSVGAVYDSDVGKVSTSVCIDVNTTADKVTCFTNMTDFLSILAPGAFITAADHTFAGTSQATPHIAGAIALLKGSHPGFTADAVADRLIATGTPLTTTRSSHTYVKPRLSLEDALEYPQLNVAPASLEFGTVTAGQVSAPISVTMTSTGVAPLDIGAVSISGSNASEFALSTDGCSNATVPAGSSCTVSITFRPLSAATKSAALHIPSNDPDWPDKSISLSGLCNSFQLTVSRNGNGWVISHPTLIDCGSTCAAGIVQGSTISLSAIPANDSLFSGWSGGCSSTGTCSVTMTSNVEVAAHFSLKPPVMLQSTVPVYSPRISSVYSAALDGAVIELQAVTFSEDLVLDRNIAIALYGGYNGSYSETVGTSTIRSLTISSGYVSVSGITIQ